jgi:hypothetical protein
MSYIYASRVHCSSWDEQWPPMCGSASASRNANDDEPITHSVDEFTSLPGDVARCWECSSIVD